MWRYKLSLELKLIDIFSTLAYGWYTLGIMGESYHTLLATRYLPWVVLHIYFEEWNGKYILLMKSDLIIKLYKLCWFDIFHEDCVKLFTQMWTYICMLLPKPMKGEKFRQSNGVLHQIGFFFFIELLKFFTFQQSHW